RRPVAVPSAVARAAAVPNVTTAAAGVTAPHGYRVERLRPIAADEFDVDGEGHVAVRTGATVRDLADGAALSEAVKSFAFAAGELDLITASGELGYLDASGVKTVGPVPFEAARLRAGDDGADLFFLRDQPPYTLGAMDASGTVRALAALPAPVDAVAGTAAHHVFSIGPDLYAQAGSEEPQLVLHLPERDQLIVGLAMPNAETLYFATHRGVYAVRGSLAMPLMLGFGGPLRVAGKTLTVLNEGDRTLYRLVAPA
ncbi:MAG TPA: hypothetical protein VK665_14570, partial [Candidatus Elarobacter sp.]|nr:hypothetical protein [Candidatus Elarobacter sp.]